MRRSMSSTGPGHTHEVTAFNLRSSIVIQHKSINLGVPIS